jgi:hypothetical protein
MIDTDPLPRGGHAGKSGEATVTPLQPPRPRRNPHQAIRGDGPGRSHWPSSQRLREAAPENGKAGLTHG